MNLPNKITLARIFMIPFVVLVYLWPFPHHKIVACVLFVLTCATDFVDGSIARKRNMITDLGKFLDPIADKVIVVVMIFLFAGDHTLSYPWGAIVCGLIMSREFIISAFRMLAVQKKVVIAADKLGKIKTVLLDIGISLLILSDYNFGNFAFFKYSGNIVFYVGSFMTIYSGFNYIIKNKSVIEMAMPLAENKENSK